MQRTYLGEFEEIVLLMVAVLDGEAYGVTISPGARAGLHCVMCSICLRCCRHQAGQGLFASIPDRQTGVGALVITLLTVSFQSLKAALMNPVKSLRTD